MRWSLYGLDLFFIYPDPPGCRLCPIDGPWNVLASSLPAPYQLEWYEERICSRLADLLQSEQSGLSANLHMCRFDGVGRTSYTKHSRNLILYRSILRMSCQVSVLSCTLSHLVQLPCLFMATALTCLLSSSVLHTSFSTMPHHSFRLVFFQLSIVMQPTPNLLGARAPMILACCRISCPDLDVCLANYFISAVNSNNRTKFDFFCSFFCAADCCSIDICRVRRSNHCEVLICFLLFLLWSDCLCLVLFIVSVYLLLFIICLILFIIIITHSQVLPEFSCDLSPNTPKSVSSHSSVICRFLVFSKTLFASRFLEFPRIY